MKLSQFNFKLPASQVALYPHKAKRVVKTASGERVFEITRRDEARLMVIHKKSETIEMYKTDENGKEMKDADGNPVFLQFKDIVNYFEGEIPSSSTIPRCSQPVSTEPRRRQMPRLKYSCSVSSILRCASGMYW